MFFTGYMIHCEVVFIQELHLQGNSIGDEGVRALMSGLSDSKGESVTLSISILRCQIQSI